MSAANPTKTDSLSVRSVIEQLTLQALTAARAGDWDQVDACYSARATSLASCTPDPALVRQLLSMDEEVRQAILVAQAGINGLLAETAHVKRHLRRLRENSGQLASDGVTIHREA